MRESDGSDRPSLLESHLVGYRGGQASHIVLAEIMNSGADASEITLSARWFVNGTAEHAVNIAFHCSRGWWIKPSWYADRDQWQGGGLGLAGTGISYEFGFRKGIDGSLIVAHFFESYDVILLYGIVPLKAEFQSVTTWYRFPPAPDQ
jgi:hypothetical protein